MSGLILFASLMGTPALKSSTTWINVNKQHIAINICYIFAPLPQSSVLGLLLFTVYTLPRGGKSATNTSDLGVVLASHLSFDSQVTKAPQSCPCRPRKLSKVKPSPPPLTEKSLFVFAALPEGTIAMHFLLTSVGVASKVCNRFPGF